MPETSKNKKKTVALILLSLLILCVAAGATLAYIVKRSLPVENVFTPVIVDSMPVSTATGRIAVRNSSDVAAYLRADVVVTWVAVDEEGNSSNSYLSKAPVLGVDYNISYDTFGVWQKGSDGFWYHTAPVPAGEDTVDLITAVERLSAPPAGYALSVEVLTTAIQSQPAAAVQQAWGVGVSGSLLIP